MDPKLESVWNSLGVARRGAGLDLTETITARTFAISARGEEEVNPVTIPSLPHLSLGGGAGGAAPAPPRGATGPDLEITGLLGEGGMGRVMLARQRSLQRDVAVKVVKAEIDDGGVLGSLVTEATTMGSLEHPSIVPVHALGRDDAERPILVMKRIEGVSWRDLARDDQHPVWARLDVARDDRLSAHLEIVMQVCNALHFAHRRGYVHRDLKPANVMVGSYGEVYLCDWGLAVKMAAAPGEAQAAPEAAGAPLGTPAFMAPEMVWGDPSRVDARTDVYLLGATLHSVLTGKPRHEGEGLVAMLLAAQASHPYAYGPEIPTELAAICNKATSADPADRYPTALAFRRAVAEHMKHRGSIALCDAASAQLAEVRAARRAAAAGDAAATRRIHRMLVECRFGLMQALREWKDNAAARAELSECLGAMIEHELSQEDREGAAALLAELPEPRPDLEQRLAALDAALRDRRDRDARLRRLEHDLDLSVGARGRSWVILVFTLCVAAVCAASLYRPELLDHRTLVFITLAIGAVVGPAMFFARKSILSTSVGRRGISLLVVWFAANLGHRLLAAALGTPIPAELAQELWVTTSVITMGAVTLGLKPYYAAAVPGAAGAFLIPALPAGGLAVYAAAVTATCVIASVASFRTPSVRA